MKLKVASPSNCFTLEYKQWIIYSRYIRECVCAICNETNSWLLHTVTQNVGNGFITIRLCVYEQNFMCISCALAVTSCNIQWCSIIIKHFFTRSVYTIYNNALYVWWYIGRHWVLPWSVRRREKEDQHWHGADHRATGVISGWTYHWSGCPHCCVCCVAAERVSTTWCINGEGYYYGWYETILYTLCLQYIAYMWLMQQSGIFILYTTQMSLRVTSHEAHDNLQIPVFFFMLL